MSVVKQGLLFIGFLGSFFVAMIGLIRGGLYFVQWMGEPFGSPSFDYACLWLMVVPFANVLGQLFRDRLWPNWPRL
jgi:hypothetical protein